LASLPVKRVADDRKLADFRIDREISRSSICSIYQGYQETLNRKVLIKSLHPQLLGDNEIRTRFEREAHALARIKHKNIVHIYDYKADDRQAVLVSEWIDGGSVEEFSKKHGPLNEKEAVALALSVLEGLSVAHQKGVIHRDIKPDNLLISINGVIKITDFGLAQFEGSPSVTQQGVTMGTPAYIAPELISGQAADQRSDLYNLGVTLYELLTGNNPFQADNLSQTLNNVASMHPEPLSGIHDEFNDLLMSLMSKVPSRRPVSALVALDTIRPLAAKFGIERGWEDVHEGDSDDAQSSAGKESRTHSTIQPIQRTRPSFFLVVLALILMASIPIIILVYNQTKKVEPLPVTVDTVSTTSQEIVQEPTSTIEPEISDPSIDEKISSTPVQTEEPIETVVSQPAESSIEPETVTKDSIRVDDIAKDSGLTSTEETIELTGHGYLYFHVRPWANVYHDNQFIIQTPFNEAVELPVGTITLSLINPQFPPIQHEVTITPGDTSSVRIDLFDKVGIIEFIDATPWAEVYIDNEYLGRTPLGKPVYLIPGNHTLILRHPAFPDNKTDFTIESGATPLRIRKNMEK